MPHSPAPHSLGITGTSSVGRSGNNSEFLMLGIVLVLFLAVCTCIQGRYLPWGDEVQFTDPAANLYYKLGFVSRQHSNQTDRTFWCGNVPGYSTLLYTAFWTFHFSQAVARFATYLVMALAVLFFWVAVRRAGFLSQPRTRLLMLVFVLTGSSCYTCYSNIRYDGLCFLECSLALLAYTINKSVIRNSCLLILGAAMALTNLQLPQYAVALILILTYVFSLGFTAIWRLRFMYLGFLVGGVTLILLYACHHGTLEAFRTNLQQQAGQSIWIKLHDLNYYFQYDPSLIALVVFLLASLAIVRIRPASSARQASIAGLLICTVIPIFFFLARRFVFSSAWMVYVPAVVCVCRVLEAKIAPSRSWKTFAAVCCVASISFGLPKALAGILTDWRIRNYAVVDTFIAASVGATDSAFCDPAAYFSARPRVARIYGPGYLEVMNAAEKRAITVLIVSPANEAEAIRQLGGKWITTRQLVRDSKSSTERLLPYSTNFTCHLKVLRRS